MLVWIIRAIKVFLIFWALLVLALVAFISFGPVSSPAAVFNAIFGLGSKSPDARTVETTLSVPKGFSLGQYATDLKAIRFMAFSNTGDLIVSQPRKGKVLLLQRDTNRDGRNDGVSVVLDNLNRPHGLAFHQDWLYIAESDAIGRVPFNHQSGELSGTYERIVTGLTDNGNHWTKSIGIKDGHLYVSMGSTCNVCEEKDPRRATIMRFDLDGNNGEIYASGLRNSVGLDFAPWDGQLYATDNGRDLLGDDYPVCELNKIDDGGFYGWPYLNGFGDPDPDFGEKQQALQATAIAPVFGFRPHNAPLGIRFLTKMQRPAGYERSALVALHGSWNRSEPDGYKVVSLHWGEDDEISSKDFLSGFEKDGNIIGRPVDIVEGADGCAYISDDYAGSIYRVCYGIEQDTLNTQHDTPANDPQWDALSPQARQQAALQGEALYALNACSSCHQLNGEGNPDGKKLQALHSRYNLSSLSEYFLTPNPPMPQYELTPLQRHDLAVYLLSQSP